MEIILETLTPSQYEDFCDRIEEGKFGSIDRE